MADTTTATSTDTHTATAIATAADTDTDTYIHKVLGTWYMDDLLRIIDAPVCLFLIN